MRRKERIQEAIRHEMGRIIQEELHDPRIHFVTVIGVEVTDDLRHAKIYYSVLGTDKEEKETVAAMDSATVFIRGIIAERLNLRFAPEIILKLDDTTKYSIEIAEKLESLKNEPFAPSIGAQEETGRGEQVEPRSSSRRQKNKKGR